MQATKQYYPLICLILLLIGEVRSRSPLNLQEGDFKKSLSISNRVVNGQNAQAHEWPWQISLQLDGRHICGGSLIKPDWVLTAAHCIEKNTSAPSLYEVVVGAHKIKTATLTQKSFHVKNIFVHEAYHSTLFRNDIALIQLNSPVSMTITVKTIQLPQQGSKIGIGSRCFITGWGLTSGWGRGSNILQEAEIPVVNEKDCRQIFPDLLDSATMICAGGEGKGGCQGDSGGPLACQEGKQWFLRGVISYGQADCRTDHYTVFTRVSSLVKWINTVIRTEGSCSDQYPTSFCERWTYHCNSYGHSILRENCRKTCKLC